MLRDKDHWQRAVKLGLPSLGTVLIEPIYTSTDSAIMGHVGTVQLAALALATGVLALVIVPFTSLGFAVTSRAARMSGAGEQGAISNFATATVFGFALMGLVVGVLVGATAQLLAPVIASSRLIADQTTTYLEIASIGIPFLFVLEAGGAFLTGLGRTRTALWVVAVSAVVNVGAELYFVFVVHLSVAGSALGTTIAQVLGAGLTLVVLRLPSFDPRAAMALLKGAVSGYSGSLVSLMVRTLALIGSISGAVFFASTLGAIALAEFQIGQQAWLLFGLSFDAIAVPAQVMIGEWSGAGEGVAIKRWSSKFLYVGLLSGIVLAALVFFSAGPIAHLFTSSAKLASGSKLSIEFAAAVMPITAVSFVVDGLVGGLERFDLLRNAMLISFAAFAVACFAVSLLGMPVGVGAVWVGFAAWLVVRAAMSLIYCRKVLVSL